MKASNTVGLVIFSIGALSIIGFGFYNLVKVILSDTTTPTIIKFGIFGILTGVFILLISLIVERIKDKKREPKI